MKTRQHHRTIMGIGAIELPEELRATLVDTPPKPAEDEDTNGYRAWVGRVIDNYRLEALIAEGGMGAVFEASRADGGMPVAFKVMHAELGANDAIVQRFVREVEIGLKLTHPNVVAVLDTGVIDDGSPYLVLELVRGPTLSHAMWEDGAFEWRRAVRIGAQIAAAIGAAWDEGFVHRDLKPDNVVLEPDGRGGEKVKLLDFGIAHDGSVAGVNAKLTVAGEVLGTAGYMAPEQSVGQGVDVRSDLYALGVLIWEMLAGYSLFDEDLGQREYLLRQIRLEPTPVSELSPDAPGALDSIVSRLLSHLQAERPGDPSELRSELLGLLEEAAEPEPTPPAPPISSPVVGAPAASSPVVGAPAVSAPAISAPAISAPAIGAAPAPSVALPPAPQVPPPVSAPAVASNTANGHSSRMLLLAAGVGLTLFGAATCALAAAVLLLR